MNLFKLHAVVCPFYKPNEREVHGGMIPTTWNGSLKVDICIFML